ncbi:MAG: dihydropteroate synthase [Planctomycetota bacterium]
MNAAELTHNPRVIAGTLAGFEQFQRFRSKLIDPLRDLLPVAVELESVPAALISSCSNLLCARGILVDDQDASRGKVRLAGPLNQFTLLQGVEDREPPGFLELAHVVARAVSARFVDSFDLPGRRTVLRLGSRPLVMGVLNLTPDSFSDGGRFGNAEQAIDAAFAMQELGADLIDVGAESTRPNAPPVSIDDELRRLMPVLEVLVSRLRVPISVDTMKAEVAERVLDLGVDMINDASGLDFDPRIAEVVARHRSLLVINHMLGSPRTMQDSPRYDDVTAEVCRALRVRLDRAIRAGVNEKTVILDPGIGFGKRVEDNLDLLARVSELRSLGRPLLLGCSRKSFLGQVTGRPVEERGPATAATTALAALRGVMMVRVHDVRETVDMLKVLDAINVRLRME